MFKKILVPVDGSDSSVMAAKVAQNIASKNDGSVTLLYVVRPYLFQYGVEDGATPEPALPAKSVETGQAILNRIREEAVLTNASLEVKIGAPAPVICSEADDGQFDLIVMGSRGITGIAEAFVGSVSQYVSHKAHCPVLLTRLPKGVAENHTIIKSMSTDYNIYL
ncbi:MAG TPA: universal stress protein [Syntrophomonas sp.]|jgi:nucleotide-binding universal stress UspA family protein|nr:universal stress protein [Syntrophomonas sp.]